MVVGIWTWICVIKKFFCVPLNHFFSCHGFSLDIHILSFFEIGCSDMAYI